MTRINSDVEPPLSEIGNMYEVLLLLDKLEKSGVNSLVAVPPDTTVIFGIVYKKEGSSVVLVDKV